jgi:hypothetical protein
MGMSAMSASAPQRSTLLSVHPCYMPPPISEPAGSDSFKFPVSRGAVLTMMLCKTFARKESAILLLAVVRTLTQVWFCFAW